MENNNNHNNKKNTIIYVWPFIFVLIGKRREEKEVHYSSMIKNDKQQSEILYNN